MVAANLLYSRIMPPDNSRIAAMAQALMEAFGLKILSAGSLAIFLPRR